VLLILTILQRQAVEGRLHAGLYFDGVGLRQQVKAAPLAVGEVAA